VEGACAGWASKTKLAVMDRRRPWGEAPVGAGDFLRENEFIKSHPRRFFMPLSDIDQNASSNQNFLEAARRKELREAEALALSTAFGLRHGVEQAPDPVGLERAQAGLEAALRGHVEELGSLKQAGLAEKERIQAQREALGVESRGGTSFSAKLSIPLIYASSPELDLLGERLGQAEAGIKEALETWAWAALKASGVADRLADPSERERLARLAGHQKSAQELKVSDGSMENRLDHYEIFAARSSQGAFERFETLDWTGEDSGVLATDVEDPQMRFASPTRLAGNVLGKALGFVTDVASEGAKRLTLAALDFKGAPLGKPEASYQKRLSSVFGGVDVRSDWSGKEAAKMLKQIESGGLVAASLSIAGSAKAESALGQTWGHWIETTQGADDVALQDKARRVCEWFDGVAGEGASELAQKVWGGAVPSGMRLGELETLAQSARALEASLEGQEALGLFSIRAADVLGLELSGRDLPERAKRRMKEAGLSEGGWRLLAKMDSGAKAQAALWLGAVSNSKMNKDIDFEVSSRLSKIWPLGAVPGRSEQERAKVAEQARQKQAQVMELFAQALSCCASRGLDARGAEMALAVMKKAGHRDTWQIFGSQAQAPEGTPAADVEAENQAKAARAPKILGDWVALAAKSPEKASDALSLASDWARNAEWGAWSAMPEGAGWAQVMMEQKRWHEMVQARERSEKSAVSWDGLSPGWSDPQTGFSAVPLTDGGMLWDEGKAMHHCVSSYDQECAQGRSRIFSIRKDGERFGTAQVRLEDGSCEVVQFKGVHNAKIHDERAWAAANGAAAQCALALQNPNSPAAQQALAQKLSQRRMREEWGGVPRPAAG
jgi:hypothetical protein